ncbi:glycosyltransferase [Acuticoccus mangrovi]|uniref:Glycosyltransferase family 4 protein n=1 Tax=Acuticoccus mangrovi TaxID=2796142 RepID=A0A934INN9_9HYPH|nr:glycosyltransferase [Acuticoccus mangrovi]MBJ3775925.1 glycosyltransferase family 4 protein [Acuticoccus mangrovi]
MSPDRISLALVVRQLGHYHAARLAAARSRFGRLTTIAGTDEGPFAGFLSADPNAVRLYPDRRRYLRDVASGALARRLAAALDAAEPDVVAVTGWASPESLAALAYARRRGLPTVMLSESMADDALRHPLREAAKRRILAHVDAALVGGPPHAAYLHDLGLGPRRIHLGYDAVDNAHFAAGADAARARPGARAALGLPPRYLLASGRFVAKKNFPTLVHAFARAAGRDGPDLVILGDGPERAAIEAAARAAGVESRVHLPGFEEYAALPALYGLAEAFVHPATTEQWGLVVNEAMAAAVPVIVSNRAGVARSVISEGGVMVDPTEASLAEAITYLLAMPAATQRARGLAARAAIAPWGVERFADGLAGAVETAVTRRRRQAPLVLDRALFGVLGRRIIAHVG